MTTDSSWTCLADVLDLEGHGLVFADAGDCDRLLARLRASGYAVVAIDTGGVSDFREAQRRIAAGLRLPATAGRNLDALADSLHDMARHWPDAMRIALVWWRPERLIDADLTGWLRLADVLADATERLWRGGAEADDRVFETLLLTEGLDG
ncbi:MAG: barstar family protein [Micropruina sp.]|uniref:barstar family protein n=1 Tax=Micropruina sp. TaxID=2737536 RepID=UPI0039E2D23B